MILLLFYYYSRLGFSWKPNNNKQRFNCKWKYDLRFLFKSFRRNCETKTESWFVLIGSIQLGSMVYRWIKNLREPGDFALNLFGETDKNKMESWIVAYWFNPIMIHGLHWIKNLREYSDFALNVLWETENNKKNDVECCILDQSN